jgi:hypothetical protein
MVGPPFRFVYSKLFISFVTCSRVKSLIQPYFHPSFNLVLLNHLCKNLRPFPWGFLLLFGPEVTIIGREVMFFLPYDFK